MKLTLKNKIVSESGDVISIEIRSKKYGNKILRIDRKFINRIIQKVKDITPLIYNDGNGKPYISTLFKGKYKNIQCLVGKRWAMPIDGDYLNMTSENIEFLPVGVKPKNFNRVVEMGDGILSVDISTDTHPNSTMLIQKSDYKYLLSLNIGRIHNWRGYAKFMFRSDGANNRAGKGQYVHNEIVKPKGVVDHINHNGLDNRRCNLRDVSQSENTKNIEMRSSNKSGRTGVFSRAIKDGFKWYACIGVNGKTKHIGRSYDTFEEACMARAAAEVKYGYHANHGSKISPI